MAIFSFKEKDGTINCRVTGYLTKDPKIPQSNKAVLFSVCYGKSKYMNCKAWLDKQAGKLAQCLEKHDEVAADGIYESYTDRNGETQWQLNVDHLDVQQEPPQATPTVKPVGSPITVSADDFTEADMDDDSFPF